MALPGLGRVLVLNAGSSSLKFKLFDLAPALASSVGGMIDRIGDTANSALIAKKTAQEETNKFKDQASVQGSSLHPSDSCCWLGSAQRLAVCCLLSAAASPAVVHKQLPIKDHVVAMETVMDFLRTNVSPSILKEVVAVGHRCVYIFVGVC